jgi:hypothetical protein
MHLIASRSPDHDVTNTVDVTSSASVYRAIRDLLVVRFPDLPFAKLKRAFHDFDRLYRGDYPGFHACDTAYHDACHVRDVTLAMARLIDGYEVTHGRAASLGQELALVGLIVALFHDAGYIRRKGDSKHSNGAAYTRIHVSRSARFLEEYLPQIGLGSVAGLAAHMVHYTGYEKTPDAIILDCKKAHTVGHLVGTADVIAQMADVAYLEKCRDRLFEEFEVGGIARQRSADGSELVIYASAADLLVKTPGFVTSVIEQRLDGYFQAAYRFAEAHFGGKNLYMEALMANRHRLERALVASNDSAPFELAV